MRILMMGTGPFAVPTFEALVESDHEVAGLITRPPAGSHRGKRKDINPMREAADKLNVEAFSPPSVNDPDFASQLASFQADLFVVCDYGQILSREVLAISRLGGVNLHGSLLPKYRGAAPINWAIFHGEPETGNTVILMTPRLDGGPILKTVTVPIEDGDDAVTIEKKLAEKGAGAVLESLAMLESWDGESPIGMRQDPDLVTNAPRLKKSDGNIVWKQSAIQIFNQVRAFQPWPGSYTSLHRAETPPLRLILTHVKPVVASDESAAAAGEIVVVEKNRLVLRTGDGLLELLELQPAGKKPMPIGDFLRGNTVQVGDRLGDAND